MRRWLFSCLVLFGVAGCTQVQIAAHLFKKANANAGPACSMSQEGHLKIGKPYKSHGVTYRPLKSSYGYAETGIASWYGADFHGRTTANGECYDMYAMTAAHRTLPLPSLVRVTNLENKRSVVLRVNDRGPYAKGRIIDLSYAAARQLGLSEKGVGPVKVVAVGGPHHHPDGYQGDRSAVKTVNNAPRMRRASAAENQTITLHPKKSASRPKFPQIFGKGRAQDVPKVATATKPTAPQAGSFSSRIVANNPAPTPQPDKPATPYRLTQNVPTSTATVEEKQEASTASFTQRAAAAEPAEASAAEEPSLSDMPKEIPQTSTEPLEHSTLYVQVGAFGHEGNANRLLQNVEKQGFTGRVYEVMKNGTPLHRVQVGPFHSIAEADATLQSLGDAGFHSAVIAVE